MVPNGGSITIRMLLNHTSGIFNYTDDSDFFASVLADPYRHWRPREVIAVAVVSHLAGVPARNEPGRGQQHGLHPARPVLQKATDESVADRGPAASGPPPRPGQHLLRQRRTFPGSYAHGYAPPSVTGDGYQDLSRWSPPGAAGALVSNPPDLARALPGAAVRTPAGHLRCSASMTTTVSPGPGFAYGLGIFALDTPCGTVWGHDGGIPARSASP